MTVHLRVTECMNQSKQEREDRACEAIIAGILRGFTDADWRKVFEKVDQIETQKQSRTSQDAATDSLASNPESTQRTGRLEA